MDPVSPSVPHADRGTESPFPASLRRIASLAALISTLASGTSCVSRSGALAEESFGHDRDSITLSSARPRRFTDRFQELSETRKGEISLILAEVTMRVSRGADPQLVALFCTSASDWKDLAACAGAQLEASNPIGRQDALRMIQYRQIVQAFGEKISGALADRCDALVSKEVTRLAALDLAKDPLSELDLALRFIHRVRGACGERARGECDRAIQSLEQKLTAVPASVLSKTIEREVELQERHDKEQLEKRRHALGGFDLFRGLTSPLTQELSNFLMTSPRWEHSKSGWRCIECPTGSGWILETQLDSDEDHTYLALRRENNPSTVIKLPIKEAARCIIEGREETLFARAYESFERGENRVLHERLRALDISVTGPALYLPVFPREFNQVISANLATSMFLTRALEARHGSRVFAAPHLFTENPAEDIAKSLATHLSRHPSRLVFLDLYAHGSPEGAHFGKELSAKDLCEVAKKFPNQNFLVKTIACYGAGMREGLEGEFKKHPELRSRITLIVETGPALVNELSVLSDHRTDIIEANHIRGSRFQNYLIRALLSDPKMNFGDAVREADRLTREHSGYDPEVLQNGELISSTARPKSAQSAA